MYVRVPSLYIHIQTYIKRTLMTNCQRLIIRPLKFINYVDSITTIIKDNLLKMLLKCLSHVYLTNNEISAIESYRII